MSNDQKYTMAELIDLIERVAKDPTYKKDQKALMDIVYLIANHVKLMGDIKAVRGYLSKQQEVISAKPQSVSAYPDVTELMKGK